ncbi:MAG: dephospho-CoA kinase, partial [Burkholderiaceae bacterium]|nr:dephospho-CoA kinase [Burkholderiaceae bacterium]
IDTDLIAHQITGPNGSAMPAIKSLFGEEFLQSDGSLDRARMRALVFNDPKAKLALEQITHPLIHQKSQEIAVEGTKKQPPYIVFMVPLLIESGQWINQTPAKIDYVAVVDCSEELQISRVVARNQLPKETVQKIIASQATRHERISVADYVIENNGTLEELEVESKRLHQILLRQKSR